MFDCPAFRLGRTCTDCNPRPLILNAMAFAGDNFGLLPGSLPVTY
jgi:hypothetical protein